MLIENYFYNDSNLKTIRTTRTAKILKTTHSATTLKCDYLPSVINKCLKRVGDHILTVIQIILLFLLGFTLLLMDLVNASVHHLMHFIPLSVVQRPRGIDDMLAVDNVPEKITLSDLSS